MKKSAGWNWVNKMGQAWVERNPNTILPLFADRFQYFETPFDKPITDKKVLLALWQEVPASQKDVNFDFEILSEAHNLTIAHFRSVFTRLATGKKTILDGIFLVKLNKYSLCTEFKWCWNTKE